MPSKTTTKPAAADVASLRANIVKGAKTLTTSSTALGNLAEAVAQQTGLLFAMVSIASDAKVKGVDLAADLREGGYAIKTDDCANKIARAGRIVLIDRPTSDADPIYGWADAAYTAVNNAVRNGCGLPAVDKAIKAAKSTDEAIKTLTELAKAAKAAKAEAKAAEAEAEAVAPDNVAQTLSNLLDAAGKNLAKAVGIGCTTDNLAALRAIAEMAGKAAMAIEAATAKTVATV